VPKRSALVQITNVSWGNRWVSHKRGYIL